MALLRGRRKIAEHEEKHHVSLELKLNEVIRNQSKQNLKLNLIIQNQTKQMTKEEFAQAFEDVNVIFQKALTEVVNAAKESGNSTPRMDAALAAAQAAAKAFDELNPDAPAPDPEV